VKAAQLSANADSHERFGNNGCEAGSDGWTLEQSVKAAAGGRVGWDGVTKQEKRWYGWVMIWRKLWRQPHLLGLLSPN